MSMSFTPSNNKGTEYKTKITYNSDSPKVFSNSKSRQIESAKFKFRQKSHAVPKIAYYIPSLIRFIKKIK